MCAPRQSFARGGPRVPVQGGLYSNRITLWQAACQRPALLSHPIFFAPHRPSERGTPRAGHANQIVTDAGAHG